MFGGFLALTPLVFLSSRIMGVLDPIKLVLTNYPEDQEDWFELENIPKQPEAGTRKVPFSKVLWVERDDFMKEAALEFGDRCKDEA